MSYHIIFSSDQAVSRDDIKAITKAITIVREVIGRRTNKAKTKIEFTLSSPLTTEAGELISEFIFNHIKSDFDLEATVAVCDSE